MKKLVVSFWLLASGLALAQITSFTTATNTPAVKLTVAPDSTLLANGRPFTFFFSGQDFVSNGGVIGLLTTNIAFTVSNVPYGSPARITKTGVFGGVAYYVAEIPGGAPGTNFITQTVFSNGVYSSTAYTLTNINPLLCTGSNYIGSFSQLYKFNLLLPNTSVGQSVGSNLNEVLWFSTNSGTSWFSNALQSDVAAIWTNVMVSVVGDNNTNYAGAITLYGLDHPEYYGRTNSFEAQSTRFADPSDGQDAVTLSYLKTYVANATGNTWRLNGTHYQFAPYDQTNIDMTIGGVYGGWIKSFASSGTNWVLTATNVPVGYQLQVNTNLSFIYGWATLGTSAGVTVATNLFSATNVWTFTVPKASVVADYAFFRVAAFQPSATTIAPPLTLQSVTIWTSNSWANTLSAITNSADQSFGFGSSNGVPVFWRWTNGVVWVGSWP